MTKYMTIITRKMAVLAALRQQTTPMSLPELLQTLGAQFHERSVRRWLGEMAKEGLIRKTGEKRGTRYFAISNKQQTTVTGFSKRSEEAISYVQQPLFKRKPVSYNQSWLASYKANTTNYLSTQLKQQLSATGKRDGSDLPAGTYARHIYNRLLIDLSYNSSRLEGNTYSLIDTKRLLIEGATAEGKLDEEKIMILNHKEAIRYLVENSGKMEIEINVIQTLHYLLADGLIVSQYAGNIRDHGVRVGGSTYIPLENKHQLTTLLLQICQKAELINNPYEQSFFLLVHLSYLQAFADVNKRTARLSANISLIKQNFVPLSFNDVEKDDYATAMIAAYELNELNPLIELYTFSYLRTCQAYDATIEAIGFDEVRVRYRQQRREIIKHIITNKLVGEIMQNYIQTQIKKLINKDDRENFIEDIQQDLADIAPHRIAGMGITISQLNAWLKKRK